MLTLATTVQMPDTLSVYNVVIFIHIAAALVAFGVTFAYPLVDAILRRPGNLQHLGWWFEVRVAIGTRLISGAATVLLLAGIYLASTGPFHFGDTFVSAGIVIIVVVLGLGGAFFTPRERKAAELAKRDIAASSGGEIQLSAEFSALAARLNAVGIASSALVLVAVFLMVVKPS